MDFITNILVIGNGFDLAHKLPTTYGDFLKFVQNFQKYQNGNMQHDNTFYSYFKRLQEEKTDIFNEIDTLVAHNHWITYFMKVFEERCKEGKTGWIDFESEISEIVQVFDSARLTLNAKFKLAKGEMAKMESWEYRRICSFLYETSYNETVNSFNKNFLPSTVKRLINDLNCLTRCLEIYLSDYLKINICQPLDKIKNLQINGVISFNYTNIFERLYGKIFPDVKYDYIHGKAKLDGNVNNCNLVLGIDEYLQGEQRDKDNEFIQFKKFFQRIYKGTGSRYIDWLDELNLLNDIDNRPDLNIYVYGHSLDVTDADIFRRLILVNHAKTHIFYHNQDALRSQIANLVKIIGEEKLIQFTDGSKRKIEFIPSY
ncbi:MAG: bacteriophage abortive infection AbiH family protein [Ruminococcus flavefaciens]|nr:bacteriophage abortive infection AbiH family protein [Ruminococcus flavefaciens]MCM1228690.1 bacteriophage abortive infection AbiH family protein [Ruminococcus flavefaciens]